MTLICMCECMCVCVCVCVNEVQSVLYRLLLVEGL